MPDVFIVCEGFRDKLDDKILNKLLVDTHNIEAKTIPAGGDSSLGALAVYVQHNYPDCVIFSIEDRNFVSLESAEKKWQKCRDAVSQTRPVKGPFRLIWRRHEIENYLIEPAVVHEYFETLRRNPPRRSGKVDELPQTLDDVRQLIEGFARVRAPPSCRTTVTV